MRFIVIIVLLPILGLGGWQAYQVFDTYSNQETERKLRAELARLLEERPAARIRCDAIEAADAQKPSRMKIRWAPVGADGKLLDGAAVQAFELQGRVAYFDTYQIIFEDDLVREGDPLRGHTLTLFARAFGDAQTPRSGQALEIPESIAAQGQSSEAQNLIPPAYRQAGDDRAQAVEQRLWAHFWELCLDPEAAKEEGVRAAMGKAVSMPMVPGNEYTLTISATGLLVIKVSEESLFRGP